jgi:hypothetical protein
LHNRHIKDNQITDQLKRVFEGFFKCPQSMKMLAVKLNIDRANICWYCREFRKKNQIGIVKKGICSITKHRVNYYTTNPELFPKSNQLTLF